MAGGGGYGIISVTDIEMVINLVCDVDDDKWL